MKLQQILEAVMAVEQEIEVTPPGAPEFATIVSRIADLQRELERARSVLGPLIPDASRPKSADEESAASLELALRSLGQAATSKGEGSGMEPT
ncbi:MAG: hypothetical protein ABI566_03105 [Pseudolysinimonas sp.]